MPAYPSLQSGNIGAILRAIREQTAQSPVVNTPATEVDSPIRGLVQNPLMQVENPQSARTIAVRPEVAPTGNFSGIQGAQVIPPSVPSVVPPTVRAPVAPTAQQAPTALPTFRDAPAAANPAPTPTPVPRPVPTPTQSVLGANSSKGLGTKLKPATPKRQSGQYIVNPESNKLYPTPTPAPAKKQQNKNTPTWHSYIS